MKVFKNLGSKMVMGSFAVVLLGGLPLVAAHAEDGSERLRSLHAERGFLGNNEAPQAVIVVNK